MRRTALLVFASVLLFSVGAAAQQSTVSLLPSTPAGAAATPPVFSNGNEFPFRIGIGYQFTGIEGQHDLSSYHDNGINTDISGYLGHGFALEGDLEAGFGDAVLKSINVSVNGTKRTTNSLFYGGGLKIGPEHGRFQPWGHVLIGGEHFEDSETTPDIGHLNGLAWQAGVGADIRIGPRAYWRVQGDYLGTHVVSIYKENYQFGTGIAFTF